MGGSPHRERRAIAAVTCPTCGAEPGQGCRLRTEAERATATGRLLIHAERRSAWQAWKRARPIDTHITGTGTTLVAISDAAYVALDQAAPATALRVPEVRTVEVRAGEAEPIVQALYGAWRVE